MIQASDLRSGSAKSRGRPLSGKRELHGYDGPMAYLAKGANPDVDMTTVQVEFGPARIEIRTSFSFSEDDGTSRVPLVCIACRTSELPIST